MFVSFDLWLQGTAGDEEGGHPDSSWSSLLQHRSLRGGPAGLQRGCHPAARQHRHLAGSGQHTHTLHHGMLWHLCVQQKHLSLVSHTHYISTSGSGFSHGWSYQRGREDDTWHHIQRRQLYRMLPPPVCHLQQAWQLHRGVCACVCIPGLGVLLREKITQECLDDHTQGW